MLGLLIAFYFLDLGLEEWMSSKPKDSPQLYINNVVLENKKGERLSSGYVLNTPEEQEFSWYFIAAGAMALLGMGLGCMAGIPMALRALRKEDNGLINMKKLAKAKMLQQQKKEKLHEPDKTKPAVANSEPVEEKQPTPEPIPDKEPDSKLPPLPDEPGKTANSELVEKNKPEPEPEPVPLTFTEKEEPLPDESVKTELVAANSEPLPEKETKPTVSGLPEALEPEKIDAPVVEIISEEPPAEAISSVPMAIIRGALRQQHPANDELTDLEEENNKILNLIPDMNDQPASISGNLLISKPNPAQLQQKNCSASPFAYSIDPHLRMLLKKAVLQLIDNHDNCMESYVQEGKLRVDSYKEYIELFARGLCETMNNKEGVSYLFDACGFDVKPDDVNLHPDWRWEDKEKKEETDVD